jgi:poly-gamma-glutamate synthesis protein (capsule biosynthesis protein)
VITIDGKHPLGATPDALAVSLCGTPKAAIRNIDPARVTTLVMSGTTALTRRIAKRVATGGVRDTVRHVLPWFESADLVHISNEVSFVRDCDPSKGPRELSFCTRERDIALLEAVNTKIVELTGSHLSDYGQRWLDHSIDMYAKRGWVWFGGGRTQIKATAPRIVEHNGNRLAFLGCNAVGTWLHAISTRAGVAACDWSRMIWQVQDLRRRGLVPIVSIQHQEVRSHDPPPGLVRDLRRFAAAGAVFVMGSQAHSAHPWDVHYNAFVHYGPGNLFFAQRREPLREAATDKLYLHAGKLLAVDQLYTRVEHGRPRLLTDRERARFLGQMADAASKLAPAEPWQTPVLPADACA